MPFTLAHLNDKEFMLRLELALLEKTETYGECVLWGGQVRNGVPTVNLTSSFDKTQTSVLTILYARKHKVLPEREVAVVRQMCGENLCVNPEHLELVPKPKPYQLGGSRPGYDHNPDIVKRFMAKVEKAYSGCWEWKGPILQRGGYGSFTMRQLGYVSARAHRVSFEIFKGRKPLPGMDVMHKCDNPRCVNPAHLKEGTHKENINDMLKKGRSAKGEGHSKAKLTEEQALAILADNRLQREIAEDYNVSVPTISDIKRGRSWGHLQRPKIKRKPFGKACRL